MANSMDDIIVYYGEFSFEKDPQKCTLVEFLKKKPEELRLFDRKVQSALKKIYHLNGTPPPLYKSFSKTEGRTLEIYCTSGGKRQNSLSRASYVPASRCIIFNNLNTTKSEEVFVDALSHELKHAENDTDEFRRIFQKADNYGKQQLAFLDEMHAYLCGIKVCHQQFPDSKNFWVNQYRQGLKEGQDPAAVEGKLLEQITAHLMNSDLYKTKYERYYPIKPSDQGISIDSLPPP